MFKQIVFTAAIILTVPLLALAAGSATSVAWLWNGAAFVLAWAFLMAAGYMGALYVLGKRREWLAHFSWVVRPTMVGLAVLLVLQGVLLLSCVPLFPLAGSLVLALGLTAVGFGWVALLTLIQALRPWPIKPVAATGQLLEPEQMPNLRERIARVAQRLEARAPSQVILGLEPLVFVTSVPIKLRGREPLPRCETLYLPTFALRFLNEQQLDALVGHELGHFRNADLSFTERFAPGLAALGNALDDISPEENPGPFAQWVNLARLPALLLLQALTLALVASVNRIRRARELEADRAGARASSNTAVALSLVKCSVMGLLWVPFRSANAEYLATGRARPNLSVDYVARLSQFLRATDRAKLGQVVLGSCVAHPIDTHPVLVDRLRALGADPAQTVDVAIDEMLQQVSTDEELSSLERAITTFENEWTRLPGRPVVVDAD